ncbi:hypothetical protein [Amycolatopsis sp. NPDC051903]|uniref:hypothetical protein n=1 Tax=Amycolatopsis sp. NPDC051903 TaxID=3363936 RepID=UPI0037B0F749
MPDALGLVAAAPLFCPGTTAFGAVDKLDAGPGAKVRVYRLGGVEQAVQFAALTGAEFVGGDLGRGLARRVGHAARAQLPGDVEVIAVASRARIRCPAGCSNHSGGGRVAGPERAEQVRQVDRVAEALLGAERERARRAGRFSELALRGPRVGEHPPGAREERVPRGGERHRPRRPVESGSRGSRSRLRLEDDNPDWLTCASSAARVKFNSCADEELDLPEVPPPS